MGGGVNIYPSIPSPLVGQHTWFIDEQNASGLASDANDGLTAAKPLLTDAERTRRMGGSLSTLPWSGEYHIRHLSDMTNGMYLAGDWTNATVFVHGSATNGLGKAVLYTGNIDAITALNRTAAAGGQPILVTSNALPVSWTASGLNRLRMRRTSDNATSFVAKDLGAKQARTWEWTGSSTFVAPFAAPSTNGVNPALNDQFVVESLVKIKQVVVNVVGRNTATNVTKLVFDSVDLGDNNIFNCSSPIFVAAVGCIWRSTTAADAASINLTLHGTRLCPAPGQALCIPPRAASLTFNGGGCDSDGGVNATVQLYAWPSGQFTRYMAQDVRVVLAGPPADDIGGWSLRQLGVFDCPSGDPVTVKSPGAFFLALAASVIWGSGNSGFGIGMRSAASWFYVTPPLATGTNLNIVGASGDMCFGNQRTQCRPFDDTAGAYLGLRTLSFANLIATIATTGFSAVAGTPQVFDPVSGCAIAMSA